MEGLLKQSFFSYLFLTVFIGVMIIQFCFITEKKTRNIENKNIRTVLCIAICSTLVCFWVYFFAYMKLYPISLAYSEYENNLTEETVGIVDSIAQDGKDRIHLIIDDTKYTMVYNSANMFIDIGKDIAEGDCVKITFGENSKYIFDIYKANVSP